MFIEVSSIVKKNFCTLHETSRNMCMHTRIDTAFLIYSCSITANSLLCHLFIFVLLCFVLFVLPSWYPLLFFSYLCFVYNDFLSFLSISSTILLLPSSFHLSFFYLSCFLSCELVIVFTYLCCVDNDFVLFTLWAPWPFLSCSCPFILTFIKVVLCHYYYLPEVQNL